jgi:hypothetical protein
MSRRRYVLNDKQAHAFGADDVTVLLQRSHNNCWAPRVIDILDPHGCTRPVVAPLVVAKLFIVTITSPHFSLIRPRTRSSVSPEKTS